MTTAMTNAPAKQPAPQRRNLQELIESRKEAMAMVLPKHLNPDRLIKIALVAISKTPKLLQCNQESVLRSIMAAAELGLDCGGSLGSAYLVPYGQECQLIIGFRGMIDLARRSGQISSIEARVVWANDKFDVAYGTQTKITHVPALDQDPGAFRLVYAVATLKDGGQQVEVMTKAQVDAIKTRSRASGNGPWVTDYPEMARKTVVRRIFKYLPVSIELTQAMTSDADEQYHDDVNMLSPAPMADGKSSFGFTPPKQIENQPESAAPVTKTVPAQNVEVNEPPQEIPANIDPETGEFLEETPLATEQQQEPEPEQQEAKPAAAKAPAKAEPAAPLDQLPDQAPWDWMVDYASTKVPPEHKLTMIEIKTQVNLASKKGWKDLSRADQVSVFEKVRDGKFNWRPGKAAKA